MGQHARPEEDLALADAVQVAVELQGFDLDGGEPATYRVPPPPPWSPRARPRPGAGPEPGAISLLSGQPSPDAEKAGLGEAGVGGDTGKGASRGWGAAGGRVTSQTGRETQNLALEGPHRSPPSFSVLPPTAVTLHRRPVRSPPFKQREPGVIAFWKASSGQAQDQTLLR